MINFVILQQLDGEKKLIQRFTKEGLYIARKHELATTSLNRKSQSDIQLAKIPKDYVKC